MTWQLLLMDANAIVCLLIMVRLMFFRKEGKRHRLSVAVLAYPVILAAGFNAFNILLGHYVQVNLGDLLLNSVICMAVWLARGIWLRSLSRSKSCKLSMHSEKPSGHARMVRGTDKPGQPTKNHGYDVIVGGSLFTSYADHPRKLITLNPVLKSTAAGRYQLLSRYWDAYRSQLGLRDFSPASQTRWHCSRLKNAAPCSSSTKAISVRPLTAAATSGRRCPAQVMASMSTRLKTS